MSAEPPISEMDLLALVEGDLDASRAAELESALARDPSASLFVARLRDDQRALRALADVGPVPADIADRVQAALERRTLLAISDGQSLLDAPPVSIVVPERPARRIPWAQDRVGRRLALAAGLLLTVGVGALIATRIYSKPARVPVVADAGADASFPPEIDPAPIDDRVAAAPTDAEPADVPVSRVETLASAEALDASAQPVLPADRAVELLRAGRLAVRVVGNEASAARVGDLTRPAELNARQWRLAGLASPDVARRVEPIAAPTPMAWSVDRSEPLWAGIDTLPWVSPAVIEWPEINAEQRVLVADVRVELAAIESLREALANVGPVEFVELPVAIPDEPGPIDASDILWWTQPPSAWTPRARVPVVVVPSRG